jgi:hypothetical protein
VKDAKPLGRASGGDIWTNVKGILRLRLRSACGRGWWMIGLIDPPSCRKSRKLPE